MFAQSPALFVPITVVGVGDFLQFQPFANSSDPDVQYLLDVIRGADLAVGDLENEVRDFDAFGHLGNNLATKEVADDWARMGIDMMSRANNQDQSDPGVWEDLRQVERSRHPMTTATTRASLACSQWLPAKRPTP